MPCPFSIACDGRQSHTLALSWPNHSTIRCVRLMSHARHIGPCDFAGMALTDDYMPPSEDDEDGDTLPLAGAFLMSPGRSVDAMMQEAASPIAAPGPMRCPIAITPESRLPGSKRPATQMTPAAVARSNSKLPQSCIVNDGITSFLTFGSICS